MRIDVITLFPEAITAAVRISVLGRAIEHGILQLHTHQLRDYTGGSPHPIDDAPYGGGPGQLMRPEPVYASVEDLAARSPDCHKILLTPQGTRFSQARARALADRSALLLFCGRYEGVDERVRPLFDEQLSIGDFVLTGGETAAIVLIDAVGRLVPGVLGSVDSPREESFSANTLEYPQYTRPEVFRGMHVPPVLLSGNHAEIARWRQEQALERTRRLRPDLLPSKSDEPNGENDG